MPFRKNTGYIDLKHAVFGFTGLKRSALGFTLSELLIALAILGMIATFTIPKVLQSQQSNSQKAIAKEVAGMVSTAYQAYKLQNTVTASTKPSDLLPYFNYLSLDTSGASRVDATPASVSGACIAARPCIVLHNGAILQLLNENFAGTATTNVIQFRLDPDGTFSGLNTDVPGVSVQFELYFDGFITTRGQARANSCHSGSCPFGAAPNYDPSWFSWN